MKKGSKQWWSLCATLLGALAKVSSIPALKNEDGSWTIDSKAKANKLALAFKSKNILPANAENEFSTLQKIRTCQEDLFFPMVNQTVQVLEALREDSGTGPDYLPARILKNCARQLAKPITILIIRILATGKWPESWKEHWIVPLFKKGSTYLVENYRGVHLTAQMSKIAERVLKIMLMPHVVRTIGYGPNQFAYSEGKGTRDALAFLMMEWILTINDRGKVIVYNSDVSGAFDRVSVERLVDKLRSKGFHPRLIEVIKSWLQQRRAKVVVGGEMSDDIFLVQHDLPGDGPWTAPLEFIFRRFQDTNITDWLQ